MHKECCTRFRDKKTAMRCHCSHLFMTVAYPTRDQTCGANHFMSCECGMLDQLMVIAQASDITWYTRGASLCKVQKFELKVGQLWASRDHLSPNRSFVEFVEKIVCVKNYVNRI